MPDVPPIELDGTHSENDFWRALRDELGDEFYVLHGLPFLTKDAVQGEVDFLVLHRELGMLNIECKGDGVFRGHNGQWYRIQPDDRYEPLKKTPSQQAKGQIEGIVDRLSAEARRVLGPFSGRFPLVFGWALSFPYARRKEINVPPGLQPEIVFDSSAVGNLAERVREAFEFYGAQHGSRTSVLSKSQFERFVWDGILEPFDGGATFAGQLDYERQRFVTLSNEQTEIIRSLLASPRIAVSGGAGTGKTVLAMHAARLLAKDGDDVLVTCFNSGLAAQLQKVRDSWGELAGSVHINNFHAICVDAAPPGSLEFPGREATAAEHRSFWAEDAPFSLLQALEAGTYVHGPWDAIIVDEAQDFYHEWWTILKTGLRDEADGEDDPKLAVFFDTRQSIFDHGSPVPTEGMTPFPLRVNYRNTKAICEVVAELGRVDLIPHDRCPNGEAPSVYGQPGPTKAQRQVGELLDRLIDTDRFTYDEVAILTPHSPRNSSLEAAEKLGRQPIVHSADDWMAGEGVLHCSISAFKGMEADIVILADVDPDDERCTADHRYVAASRAKLRLHVFEKGNWLEV
ncbi:MAG: NERD domain-containing protein [Persicimonas sp.]